LVIRPETSPKEALEELYKVKKLFDQSLGRLDKFKSYQETLELPSEKPTEIDVFTDKYQIRDIMWTVRRDFGEAKNRWYRDNWRTQDAQQIIGMVQEKTIQLTRLSNRMALPMGTTDDVLEAARGEVMAVRAENALITALGTPAMLDQHWTKVWSLIGGPPSSLQDFTLTQLIEAGVKEHIERVEEIAAFAAGEASILRTVTEISALW